MKTVCSLFPLMIAIPVIVSCSSVKKMELTVSSNAFKNNGYIPSKYTCDGENISPQLSWTAGPEGTKTYVLICDDPDAPAKVWVHWLIFNMPANMLEIPENSMGIAGAKYGTTDSRKMVYGGPCPPGGTHHYHFKIYALDNELPIASGATKSEIESAMTEHILAFGELVGLYTRK